MRRISHTVGLFEKISKSLVDRLGIQNKRVRTELNFLYGGKTGIESDFVIGQISKSLKVLTIGVGISFIVFALSSSRGIEKNVVERNEFGKGEQELTLLVQGEMGKQELDIVVLERVYTQEELWDLSEEYIPLMEQNILGLNSDPTAVTTDLNFEVETDKYPFQVGVSTDSPEWISTTGQIREEVKEEIPVCITTELSYEEFCLEHSFYIMLVPVAKSELEMWKQELLKRIEEIQNYTQSETSFLLPEEVNGKQVSWAIKSKNKSGILLALSVLASVLTYLSKESSLKKEIIKRKEEISLEYPDFVGKFTLLLTAGMTLRQAFYKIATDYQNRNARKRYLYEEMLIAVREMESGIPEGRAYENFGRRCGTKELNKFGVLLSQNLRKGAAGLNKLLKEEVTNALSDRKEEIQKRGERAGTQLLFPMMILLLVVMVMIMVPAFCTFSL